MLGKISVSSATGGYELLDAPHSLYQQSLSACQYATPDLCGPHQSGCGLAWCTSENDLALERRSEDDRWNFSFQQVIRELRTHAFIAHNRKASPGLKVSAECSHPYLGSIGESSVGFCHNGGIESYFPQAKAQGISDSQIFFTTMRERISTLTFATYVETIRTLARELDYSSLTHLLLTPDALFASRCYATAKEEDIEVKNARYYTLYLSEQDGFSTIASEPVDTSSSWRLLDNRSAVMIRRESGRLCIEGELL